jgi:hypothetical protein
MLDDLDEIGVGPQDLDLSFTWDGLDDWLCEKTAEIEKEGLESAMTISREEANFPLPQEATGPPDGPPSELILAPINAEGPEESLLDGALQRVAWHESQGPAWAFEGTSPSGEVHGYPLHLLDLYFEDPFELEPNIALMKAGRLAFVERVHVHPNPLPGLGAAAADLDAYTRASVLLEGEQNTNLPVVGSEQYVAPCAPHPFSFLPLPLLPPLSDTCTCGIMPGEGAAPVRCAADPCLKVLKPPDRNETPLEEPGGVLLGYVHTARKAGAKAIEHVVICYHQRWQPM